MLSPGVMPGDGGMIIHSNDMNRFGFNESRDYIRLFKTISPWVIGFLVFILSYSATAWRLDKAPDIFTDEIIYTRIGIRVSGEGALVWDSGDPFLVHPPLYFLTEGSYFSITGDPTTPLYSAGDIFNTVYQARFLNAFLAGMTALALYLLGRRLRGSYLGLLLVALFILDPFGLRINRRAMLETIAALLALVGIAILLTGEGRRSTTTLPRAILAGLLLGLALLAKEITFVTLVAVTLFGLWEIWRAIWIHRRMSLRNLAPFVTIVLAGLTYAIYPIWVLTTGYWARFMDEKMLAIKRLVGLVQLTGWNRPGISLTDLLVQRLADYGSSYLILALGGVATIWILLRGRNTRTGRLLGVLGLALYPFYGFITLFGSGNDQFFYLLLVPATLLVGCAITMQFENVNEIKTPKRWQKIDYIRVLITSILLLIILPYNLVNWIRAYAIGIDNGYLQLTNQVQRLLPEDKPLNASGDAVKFHYFFPDRVITDASTPGEAQAMGVHYFVLAPKDVLSHYGRIQPELANWIMEKGELIYVTKGDSYGSIILYRVDYPGSVSTLPQLTSTNRAHWRSFGQARAGFVGALQVGLTLWIVFWGIVAVGFAAASYLIRLYYPPRPTQPSMDSPRWQAEIQPKVEVSREGS